MKAFGMINDLSVEQEVGGSSPPNCTNKINNSDEIALRPIPSKVTGRVTASRVLLEGADPCLDRLAAQHPSVPLA